MNKQEKQRRDDIVALADSEAGRRFFRDQLALLHCGSFSPEPLRTAFMEGQRLTAINLKAELQLHAPAALRIILGMMIPGADELSSKSSETIKDSDQ